MLRVFGHLKHHPKGRIVFDPRPLNLNVAKFEDQDWTDLYPFTEEHMPDDVPKTHMEEALELTIFVDANHAGCDQTKRSTTGVLVALGSTTIKSHCKRQHTVESSTYGSEIVAMRIATEMALEFRCKMRMMGIKFKPTTIILCDNMSVAIDMKFPTSNLKKKHNAVACLLYTSDAADD